VDPVSVKITYLSAIKPFDFDHLKMVYSGIYDKSFKKLITKY